MIEFLGSVLPIIIYVLLIIILIVGIILGIKTITTMGKVEKVVDNVSDKVESLNGIFSIIDFTTDKLALITDKVVDSVSGVISKLFKKKTKQVSTKKEEEE